MKKFSIEIGKINSNENGVITKTDLNTAYSSIIRFEEEVDVKRTLIELMDTAIIAAYCMKLDELDKHLISYKNLIKYNMHIDNLFKDQIYYSTNLNDGSYVRISFGED